MKMICIRCGEDKPSDDYYARLTWCKECHKSYVKERIRRDPARHYEYCRRSVERRTRRHEQRMRYDAKYRDAYEASLKASAHRRKRAYEALKNDPERLERRREQQRRYYREKVASMPQGRRGKCINCNETAELMSRRNVCRECYNRHHRIYYREYTRRLREARRAAEEAGAAGVDRR